MNFLQYENTILSVFGLILFIFYLYQLTQKQDKQIILELTLFVLILLVIFNAEKVPYSPTPFFERFQSSFSVYFVVWPYIGIWTDIFLNKKNNIKKKIIIYVLCGITYYIILYVLSPILSEKIKEEIIIAQLQKSYSQDLKECSKTQPTQTDNSNQLVLYFLDSKHTQVLFLMRIKKISQKERDYISQTIQNNNYLKCSEKNEAFLLVKRDAYLNLRNNTIEWNTKNQELLINRWVVPNLHAYYPTLKENGILDF